ncbi:MAG: tryptophan--tRNA ligase [Micrococcales bacterium]|nr:MAG: tryptophan--tRNA ligase [Micrococcales bacterium]
MGEVDSISDSFATAVARSNAIEADLDANPGAYRVLTGDRPTGPLHLGHYFGTLRNRVRLQDRGVPIVLVIADYQVITDRDTLPELRRTVLELIASYLSCGIDPTRTTIFTHSAVPALNQLMLPFLSLMGHGELLRNPTVKTELEDSGGRALSGLLLTYPVHQAADILFCHGNVVPVGRDQLPHIEATRLVARRFNERYAGGRQVFTEPSALLSQAPVLLGTDGSAKMSKSKGNTIDLAHSEDETAKRIKRAKTDPDRHITYDPANRPEVANLLLIAELCRAADTGEVPDPAGLAEQIGDGGAGTLKRIVTEAVNEHLRPLRARHAELMADPAALFAILAQGNARANEMADATLNTVRSVMGMDYSG